MDCCASTSTHRSVWAWAAALFALASGPACSSVAFAADAQQPPDRIFVNSRAWLVQLRVNSESPARYAGVWLSSDRGETWTRVPAELTRADAAQAAIRVAVDQDGEFWVRAALARNEVNLVEPPPESPPLARVVVDSMSPTVQILPETLAHDAAAGEWSCRATIVDEHLTSGAIQVFGREGLTYWRLLATATWDGATIRFTAPAQLSGDALRIVVTDRAGNATRSEVPIPESARAAVEAATTQPIDLPASNPAATEISTSVDRRPPVVASPATRPAVANEASPGHLLSLARQLLSERRRTLAIERLRAAETSAIARQELDLVCEAAQLYAQADCIDDAERLFNHVLSQDADHPAALEGAALIAIKRQKFSLARNYLAQLASLDPDSAIVWLRLGDVEHRLGNSAEAIVAWRRAAESPAQVGGEAQPKAKRRLELFATEIGDTLRP